jgi:hypothetical protein
MASSHQILSIRAWLLPLMRRLLPLLLMLLPPLVVPLPALLREILVEAPAQALPEIRRLLMVAWCAAQTVLLKAGM